MSEVNINYKGSKIAGMDASGTKTLLTDGKYCEDDITVEYTRPSGGGNEFIILGNRDAQGNLTIDKTFAEVSTAYSDGKSIYVKVTDANYGELYALFEYRAEDIPLSFVIHIFIYASDGYRSEDYYFYQSAPTYREVGITYYDASWADAIPSDVASGKTFVNSSGGQTGTASGGTSKNTQVVQSTTRTSASTLTAIGAELTVSKTGTYDIYYSCFRTNTSSSYTWATRLYINGTAYGTAENATWTNNQQNTHLSNISLTADDKLRVYGRNTRGTSYYICAPTLAIVEA